MDPLWGFRGNWTGGRTVWSASLPDVPSERRLLPHPAVREIHQHDTSAVHISGHSNIMTGTWIGGGSNLAAPPPRPFTVFTVWRPLLSQQNVLKTT